MSRNVIELIKENVIQGRVTKDDEGMEEGMVGNPGVTELIEEADDGAPAWEKIQADGLPAGY